MPAALSFAGLAALVFWLLLVSGQPLVTDDAWLHLALGKAYAANGPWLEADPLLAAAPGPPTPAAWLFDVALVAVERMGGFAALRLAHVVCVVAILLLAWRLLRRASGSMLAANLATGLFLSLSAYRLIQLRPHLFTILATLLLYRIAIERERIPTRRDIVMITVVFALWANVHAAFLLGPLLLSVGVLGLVIGMLVREPCLRDHSRRRALSLIGAATLGGLATLLNPTGIRPHLSYFVAGHETPALARVADEWSRVDLFALPPPDLPPSLLSWLIVWALVVGTVGATVYAFRRWRERNGDHQERTQIDPVLVSLALVGLVLPLVAVRFLWLGIFPIILLCDVARRLTSHTTATRLRRWVAAVAALLLVPAFMRLGPWPMISTALPATWAAYRQPYHAGKYHAGLVWMLQDAGLRGTAYTDYHVAGFTAYHLAPDIRTLVNGTLNVTPDVISANLPLRLRRGERPGESFSELLDRHGIDIFVGIRMPRSSRSARPWFHTTAHLERTDGWIPIFRNFTGAVYLRVNERNRTNLDRVVSFYADQSLPFDPAAGFDPERIVRENRSWARQHGLVPLHFDRTTRFAYGADQKQRSWGRDQLASIYATLGLYELAIQLDEVELDANPEQNRTRRRLVWCLLRVGRASEAAETAKLLEESPRHDVLSRIIADGARRVSESTEEEERRSLAATLPLFTRAEAAALTANLRGPSPRARLERDAELTP